MDSQEASALKKKVLASHAEDGATRPEELPIDYLLKTGAIMRMVFKKPSRPVVHEQPIKRINSTT